MQNNRELQVTMNNIIGATRFKTMEKGQLMKAKCPKPKCKEIDSWEHFKKCYQIPPIADLKRKDKIQAIITICKKAVTDNPIKPLISSTPYHQYSSVEE